MTVQETTRDFRKFDPKAVVDLASDLVKIPSANPEGDMTEIATFLREDMARAGFEVEWIEPAEGRINLVATVEGAKPGPHVVMNAHLDAFPVADAETWSFDPYSGAIEDGRLLGRGANDMKAGLAAFVRIYQAAAADRENMAGKLTLMLVCDEETYGPWGALWMVDKRPDLIGDLLLSTEPSGMGLMRTAERGMIWFRASFSGKGGHGAHPVRERNVLMRSRGFMDALEKEIADSSIEDAHFLVPAEEEGRYDEAVGPGAMAHIRKISANFGRLDAGIKVNMQPSASVLEVDMRIPPGLVSADVLARVQSLAEEYECDIEVMNFMEPNITASSHPIVVRFQEEVSRQANITPVCGPAPGCSDARLWRDRGIPAIGFGPYPHNMGGTDEYCDVEELEITARVHYSIVEAVLFNSEEGLL